MKRLTSIFTAYALAIGLLGVGFVAPSESQAATKYTVSKKAGTYTDSVSVKVTAKKGYKVYYTEGTAKFTAKKLIKSGKNKSFTFKKSTSLKLITLKKNAKATAKKLNSKSYKSKIKTYKYTIKNSATSKTGNIVVLFTNDVHCAVDTNIGYAGLAAYKNQMIKEGNEVLIVDDGDMIQGGTMGTLTKGEAIINIMNAVGYDIAIPGNHEFDYGMDRFFGLERRANFPFISCNFTDLRTGETVFSPYVIKEIGGKKIAFIGATTPTSITTSTPKYFEDDDGNFIYGFKSGDNGAELYKAVQKSVDDVRALGADYCILISHLGIKENGGPFMSTDVIKNTTGIDVVLDGHSHTVMPMEKVKNKDGKTVLLTQTGTQLENIGKLTIDVAGQMRTELISKYTEKDEAIARVIADERAEYDELLARVIATSDFDLSIYAEDGKTRIVRNVETNLGDFVADAYRYAMGGEIGLANGGGIRVSVPAGNITYEKLLNVNAFGNVMCLRKVTGQELLDALEYSVRLAPDENGGFYQVSGITYDIDLSKDAKAQVDEHGFFTGFGSDERRVSNVKVNGVTLDLKREYTVASSEYVLKEGGDGWLGFSGEMVDTGKYITDVEALAEYLGSMGGKLSGEYRGIYGQGRINFINQITTAK